MSVANHNVVKAHSFARQADEALESKQWEAAIHLYQQAADLFLLGTNDTSDLESIKALQLLSTAQANKSKALLRHLQHFNSRNVVETPSSAIGSSDRVVTSSEPMDDISLSASENYFVGQSPPSESNPYLYLRERTYRREEEKQVEKKSTPTDLWGWMERMLEILYLPESFKSPGPTSNEPQNSSLLSSFYFVPDREEEEKPGRTQDGGDKAPIPLSSSRRDSEVKELNTKVNELQEKITQLTNENTKLKNKLQNVYAERMEVSKENDFMKKSILHFRQEFKKKAHQLRDISSSVGHLPSLDQTYQQQREQQLEQAMQQMRLQIDQLQGQLTTVTNQSNRQTRMIEAYEAEFQKRSSSEQRRSGQFYDAREVMSSSLSNSGISSSQILSSTILSNEESDTTFEPDESLTNSQILN